MLIRTHGRRYTRSCASVSLSLLVLALVCEVMLTKRSARLTQSDLLETGFIATTISYQPINQSVVHLR